MLVSALSASRCSVHTLTTTPGYAADGYARIKGAAAIMTTFGVGELSAINAIAGSYAEYVPVVHIVGSPSTVSQRNGMVLHHSLGDGDFKVFGDIYKRVTVAQATLNDPRNAPAVIDSVLRECWIQRRPVYFELPADMVLKDVDASALQNKIDLSPPANPPELEQVTTNIILEKLYAAKQPVLLVDACVQRRGLISEVDTLIRKSGLPTFSSPMAKSVVNETLPNFVGVYAGDGSHEAIRAFIEKSDCVLSLGSLKSDFNTTGFTYRLSTLNSIDLHTDFVSVGYARYDVHMAGVLSRLTSSLEAERLNINRMDRPRAMSGGDLRVDYPKEIISQEYLWPKLSDWLRPDDILITETGTAYLGVWDTKFPQGLCAISQTLWGSIGYALPASQGAALAARELGGKQRVILFEGDGSMQLTAQAIGTMIKHNLDIIIFIINNDGYTIERWIHGMEAEYNDIPMWRYADTPRTMGGTEKNSKSYIVKTKDELEGLWTNDEFRNPKGMHVS